MKFFKLTLLICAILWPCVACSAEQLITEPLAKPPFGVIDDDLVGIGYSGSEKLAYDVSWTGGIKIGELHMEINAIPEHEDAFEIKAVVTTKNGAVHYLYPIKDVHITKVKGKDKLPYHYEVWQKEGYNYQAHRIYEYDQQAGVVRYSKDGEFKEEFQTGGSINNEFSSFFNSRLMKLVVGESFIVPTFADKRRAEVKVNVVSKTHFAKTLIGPVLATEILPVLQFEGLYKKRGDTVIWYSDDECRVPIRVRSKIVIGSLSAELVYYDNPSCQRYQFNKKQ